MEVIDKGNGTWIIEDSGVRCFLLEGKDKAALIDTCMNIGNIKEVLARRQCQRKYKYIRYFFHNPVFLSISLKHHIQSEREQTVRQITILRIDIP